MILWFGWCQNLVLLTGTQAPSQTNCVQKIQHQWWIFPGQVNLCFGTYYPGIPTALCWCRHILAQFASKNQSRRGRGRRHMAWVCPCGFTNRETNTICTSLQTCCCCWWRWAQKNMPCLLTGTDWYSFVLHISGPVGQIYYIFTWLSRWPLKSMAIPGS